MSLPELLRTARCEPGRLAVGIPECWMQGRTTYGGLSAALAHEAARTAIDGLPPLRAAQVAFIGPVAGDVEVTSQVERQGRNASWVRSELRCAGQLCLAATFVFMGPSDSAVALDHLPVDRSVLPPGEALLVPEQPGPVFLSQFENRRAVPLHGDGSVSNWVRLKERCDSIDPFTHLLVVGDGLPPGAKTLMNWAAPVSSMVWQAGFLTSQPATRDGWWLLRSAADFAQAGASTQAMHIWNSDRQPVASGTQSIAIFG
jgi:acyl-CoA thioesterase